MNAKIFVGIALVLSLLVGGFAYVSTQGVGTVVVKSTPTPAATSAVPTQTTVSTATLAPTVAPTKAPTASPGVGPATFSVRGKVTAADTGAPVTYFAVFLYKSDPGTCDSIPTGALPVAGTTLQPADGTFEVGGIPAGTYLMGVSPRGSQGSTYNQLWWQGKPNCQNATPVVIQSNLSNLNFALMRR